MVEHGRKITIAYNFIYSHVLYQYNFNAGFLILSHSENNSKVIIYFILQCINIAEIVPPDLYCEGSTWTDHKLL